MENSYKLTITEKDGSRTVTVESDKSVKQTVIDYLEKNGYNPANVMQLAKHWFTHKYEYVPFVKNEGYTAIEIETVKTGRKLCFLYSDIVQLRIKVFAHDDKQTELIKRLTNICELCPNNPLHVTFDDMNFIYDEPLDFDRKATNERRTEIGEKMYAYIMETLDMYDSLTPKEKYDTCDKYLKMFDYMLEKRDLLLKNVYNANGWSVSVDKNGNIFHDYGRKNVVKVF